METIRNILTGAATPVAVTKVLNTPELLDKILSLLNCDDLARACRVSPFWLSIATLTLRRRRICAKLTFCNNGCDCHDVELCFNRFSDERGEELEFTLKLQDSETSGREPTPLDAPPPHPIPADFDDLDVKIFIGKEAMTPKLDTEVDEMFGAFIARTLLTFDWSSKIRDLSLNAVSVREWNSLGLYLLSVMKSLQYLLVEAGTSSLGIAGLGETVPAVDLSAVVSKLRRFEIIYRQRNNQPKRERLLALEFLKVCPMLEKLELQFLWNGHRLRVFVGHRWVPFEGRLCALWLSSEFVIFGDPRIIEMNAHLTTLKPKVIHLESDDSDILRELSIEATSNLETLAVTLPVSTEPTISTWTNVEGLSGVKNIILCQQNSFVREKTWSSLLRELPAWIFAATPGGGNQLSNVTSLHIRGKDTCYCDMEAAKTSSSWWLAIWEWWTGEEMQLREHTAQMWKQAAESIPNVLKLSLEEMHCECFWEHAHMFRRLRHLVVSLTRPYRISTGICHESRIAMLKGLGTFSVLFSSDAPAARRIQEIKHLMEAVASAPNLQIFQVFLTDDREFQREASRLEAILQAHVPEEVK